MLCLLSSSLAHPCIRTLFDVPPSITQMKLSDCRRVVLFQREPEEGVVHVRHYVIVLNPRGLSKPIKRLAQDKMPTKSLPDHT